MDKYSKEYFQQQGKKGGSSAWKKMTEEEQQAKIEKMVKARKESVKAVVDAGEITKN